MLPFVFVSWEYLRSLGWLGFSYGDLGYSQWNNFFMLPFASIGGVWILTFFCAFFSSFLSFVFYSLKLKSKNNAVLVSVFVLGVFSCIFSLGKVLSSPLDCNEEECKSLTVCAVQNNTDSSKYEVEFYRRDVSSLLSLSEKALEDSDIDIIVWPETSVVPPVEWNLKHGTDSDRLNLINEVLNFAGKIDSCLVLGNQSKEDDADYNAALVFNSDSLGNKKENPLIYRKIHLVPFTEYFAWKNIFPHIYKILLNGDSRLWEKGSEFSVFRVNDVGFSTPICFEDTFGSLCRTYVNNGADFLINLSNDSWAKSNTAQNQHLSMAVFRAVENECPLVRSTASGVTCVIGANGKILKQCESFSESYVVEKIKINGNKKTFYTRFGNWFAFFCVFVCVIIFIYGVFFRLLENKSKNGVECSYGKRKW